MITVDLGLFPGQTLQNFMDSLHFELSETYRERLFSPKCLDLLNNLAHLFCYRFG